MSDFNYYGGAYCALCDKYFLTIDARARHIERSRKHPECQTCGRRFLNGNILRNHYALARGHHYCQACRIVFRSAGGLRTHVEYAAIHRDDDDDDDEDSEGEDFYLEDGAWEDDRGEQEFPDEESDHESDGGDNSWEDDDDCDFENEEELGDGPFEFGEESHQDADKDDGSVHVHDFNCPMCQTSPKVICTTMCGHLFCAPCIRDAYQYTEACPVCDETGSMKQVRRVYFTSQ